MKKKEDRFPFGDLDHLEWMLKQFSQIVHVYILWTSTIEDLINRCISHHFVNPKERKLTKQLIAELIMGLTFKNKFAVFKNILFENYNEVYQNHIDDFELLSLIYSRRNSLSHSIMLRSYKEIRRRDKTRLGYHNMKSSTTQPVYIKLVDYKKDGENYDKLIVVFEGIYEKIKSMKRYPVMP